MIFPFYDYDSDFFSTEDLLFLAGASGKAVEDTATGNPLTFLTDIAKPLKSLIANFLPVQASGTPSPENVLPITGWDAVNVGHAGKNMLNPSAFSKDAYYTTVSEDTVTVKRGDDRAWTSDTVPSMFLPKGKYVLTRTNAQGNMSIRTSIDNYGSNLILTSDASRTFTLTADCTIKIKLTGSSVTYPYDTKMMIEVGDTASEYEPYNGTVYPVTWSESGTVYGGYVDMVTGEVWATWKEIDLGTKSYSKRSENTNRQVWEAFFSDAKFTGSSPYSAEAKCSQFDLTTSNGSWTVGKFAPALEGQSKVFIFVFPPNSFANGTECKTAMEGVQLAYKLTSPVLITTLTPQQINAIKGNNTIWSDANGDCSVAFLKKG